MLLSASRQYTSCSTMVALDCLDGCIFLPFVRYASLEALWICLVIHLQASFRALACPLFSLLHLAFSMKRTVPFPIVALRSFVLIMIHRRNYYCDPMSKKLKYTVIILFHVLVTTGVAIVASGASSLQSSSDKPVDSSKVSKDASSVNTGMGLLTLAWAIIAIVSVWILARPAKSPMPRSIFVAGTRVSLLPRLHVIQLTDLAIASMGCHCIRYLQWHKSHLLPHRAGHKRQESKPSDRHSRNPCHSRSDTRVDKCTDFCNGWTCHATC